MAVKSSARSYDGGLHLILALSEVRDTVRDERIKRLAKEASQSQRLTYTSGQANHKGKSTQTEKAFGKRY